MRTEARLNGRAFSLAPFLQIRTPSFALGACMTDDKRADSEFVGRVRETDIEPYTALRWLGTLFKAAAVFVAVALLGQFIAGLRYEGAAALPVLLGEMARTIVLAVVLWGGGDLVKLLIQLGNDVRAERILLARLVHRTPVPSGEERMEEPLEAPEEDAEEDAAMRASRSDSPGYRTA
jgi:hypothetical protein